MDTDNILVTGGAGFIGSHVCDALLQAGFSVYCIDNFDPFYASSIKLQNIHDAGSYKAFHLFRLNLSVISPQQLAGLFGEVGFKAIIHLAGRAGVRPSLADPDGYYDANVKATLHLLEFARIKSISQFVFSSSSSVYGNNPHTPWKEGDLLHEPVSPYGASKLAAEEIGQVYAGLYNIRFIILRLFTVFGPRQRPDLAIHQFYDLMNKDLPITLFGDGSTKRDYTYVKDIVNGILAALRYNSEKCALFNLGNNRQIELIHLVKLLETCLGKKARIRWQKEQPGDVRQTCADITRAASLLGYAPATSIEEGIIQFVHWKQLQEAYV